MHVYLTKNEVRTMKYETPELRALTPAINAVLAGLWKGLPSFVLESVARYDLNERVNGYTDWEE